MIGREIRRLDRVDLLRQALLNLAQNAIQAMPEGGAITLRAQPGPDGQVALLVKDQGVGIPEEDMESVFRLYHSTKPDGTGIGLALVYRIAQRHGRTARIRSTVGKGTTVILTLPQLTPLDRDGMA